MSSVCGSGDVSGFAAMVNSDFQDDQESSSGLEEAMLTALMKGNIDSIDNERYLLHG